MMMMNERKIGDEFLNEKVKPKKLEFSTTVQWFIENFTQKDRNHIFNSTKQTNNKL